MICIILRQPNGNGTYTPRIGLTTSDSTVSIGGVNCVHGYLSSVSELSHRINISGARGATAEPIEWGFDLIDWETTARRSVGILDGSVQLVGWVASLYVLQPSTGIWSAAVLSETAFEIVGAPVKDGLISISCRERWIGNRQTVGFGTGTNRVGLVAGGRQVSVKTEEFSKPEAIPRIDLAGDGTWKAGVPGAPIQTAVIAYAATSTIDYGNDQAWVWFRCSSYTPWVKLRDLINSRGAEIVASGRKFATPIRQQSGLYAWGGYTGGIYSVGVRVTADFVASEMPADIGIFFRAASSPIIGGAESLLGWVNGQKIVTPMADVTLSDFVVSAAPTLLLSDGFASMTRIDCSVSWDDPATAPSSRVAYYGNVSAIPGGGPSTPAWDSYAPTTLIPSGSPSTMTAWGWLDNSTLQVKLPLRVHADPSEVSGFDALVIDVRARAIWHNASDECDVTTYYPWLSGGTNINLSPGEEHIEERPLLGYGANINSQRFASLDDINSSAEASLQLQSVNATSAYGNIQIGNIHLYGISSFAFGSSYAVVQPGASPWWVAPVNPAQAASDLLDAIGGTMAASNPSYSVPAANWGRAFDQSTTFIEAAKELADEFWFVLGRGANGTAAGSEGELPGPPSFTMGDRNDVVTEIVIEYDEWAGEFRRRAYIAHVDEAYDSGNPDRYFGGWDTTGGGWGLTIWNACRKAWLHHGIKASETYQSPSISDPSTLGRMWANAQRSGRTRIGWLSMQARYMTVRIPETYPLWWAGNTVTIPTTVAGWSGYDLSEVAGVQLVVTEKTWDPVTLTTVFEVAMPPTVPGAGGDVIQQTASAGDDLIQQTSSISDNILQQVGN